MTHQRIRIRTDIFQSQEFAVHEGKADEVPLILPTPVPTILKDMFKPIDEPEGLRLGNGKDCWAAFDERRNDIFLTKDASLSKKYLFAQEKIFTYKVVC